jgi:hypothetical protein
VLHSLLQGKFKVKPYAALGNMNEYIHGILDVTSIRAKRTNVMGLKICSKKSIKWLMPYLLDLLYKTLY